MADLNTIIRELRKKHYTKENLSQFIGYMKNGEHRMALLQLALQYPIFYETMSELEAEDCPECLASAGKELVSLVNEYVLSENIEKKKQEGVERADALRQKLTHTMKTLSYYTDSLLLYEYVINRKEYCFRDASHISALSDTELKDCIMGYLTSDTDNQAAQLRTIEMLAQLPMRMTKQRFFQIIEDSLSIYIGSEKSTVEELVYMLKSAAGMQGADTEGLFSELAGQKESIGQVLAQELDAKKFQAAADCLERAMDAVNVYTDCVLLQQEIVNQIYVLLLTEPFGLANVSEQKNCLEIFRQINLLFAEEDRPEIGESLDELFVEIEGIQERLNDQIEQMEGVIADLPKEYEDAETAEGLKHLRWCTRLQSSSLFAELEQPDQGETAEEEDVRRMAGELCGMYRDCFKEMPKLMVRGVMSNAITMLPLFVRNYQEIENYVLSSLKNCTDAAEKAACTELILEIIHADWQS